MENPEVVVHVDWLDHIKDWCRLEVTKLNLRNLFKLRKKIYKIYIYFKFKFILHLN